jgi:hypothetical protein
MTATDAMTPPKSFSMHATEGVATAGKAADVAAHTSAEAASMAATATKSTPVSAPTSTSAH